MSFGRDDQLARLLELSGLRNHAGIKKLAALAELPRNAELRAKLTNFLADRAALSEQEHPFLSPDEEELAGDGVLLGDLMQMNGATAGAVKLPLSRLPEHLYVAGAPGTGKSFLLKLICLQLAELDVPFWWLDSQGDVYADLAAVLGPEKVLYIPVAHFKRNPLEPLPGEEPTAMLARLLDVCREAMYLRDGSQNMLGRIVLNLLAEHGVFQGSETYPSMLDLSEKIDSMKFRVSSREAGYHETLVNRFHAIEDQLSGCYDCSRGFDLSELAKRSVVIGLHGLSTDLQELFVKELLASVSALLRASLPAGKLQLALILDEAHRWASREKVNRFDLGEPLLFRLARELRKNGISLILADQTPSQIAPQILAVCNTRVVFRLLNGACMRVMSDGLALDQEQRGYLAEIPGRRAVIQSSQYLQPFVFEVPELAFPPVDEALLARNEELLAQLKWTERSLSQKRDERSASRDAGEPVREKDEAALSKELLDYLVEIAKSPFSPATERDRKLGISNWKGNANRNQLEGNGWIVMHGVRTGRQGSVRLAELTAKAWELLRRLEVKVRPPRGKGSFVHKWYQWRIKKWAEAQGLEAKIEHGFPGKQVDVAVWDGDQQIAIEVELSAKHSLVNVTEDIRQHHRVVVVSPDEHVLQRAERQVRMELSQEDNKRVMFVKLEELIKGNMASIGLREEKE